MIRVEDLAVRMGRFSMQSISLEIPTGHYGVLMGRTGCGKTTLLEAILGLRPVLAGRIEIAGRDVTRLAPALRGIGYVPQDGALFSRLPVRQHFSLPLEIRRLPAAEIRARVAQMAEWLGIEYLLDRKPPGLSGGERQRVALGRALIFKPSVLCLDEPLSALDAETRQRMCQLLQRVTQLGQVAVLHVTHHLEEARLLADKCLVFEQGQLRAVELAQLGGDTGAAPGR
jgi:molybdate/tungstate transport system ATP-binding protein